MRNLVCRKTILLCLLYTYANLGVAQQQVQYTMYMLNPFAINPAAAGLEPGIVLNGVYRKQWNNLAGAPETKHVNLHMPVQILSSGVGIVLENTGIGAHSITKGALAYNYQLELGKSRILSLGIGAGYLQYALDGTQLRAPQGAYNEPAGIFTHNDNNIPEGNIGASAFYSEIGLYLQSRKLEVGISILPIAASDINLSSGLAIKQRRNILLYSSYRFTILNGVELSPSVLLKSDANVTQIDFSLKTDIRSNIFAGLSFRGFSATSTDAISVLFGTKLNSKTSLAYSFDIPMSDLKQSHSGSHELLLKYMIGKPLGKGILPPIIHNPRHL